MTLQVPDLNIPRPALQIARRWFVWVIEAVLALALFASIYNKQPEIGTAIVWGMVIVGVIYITAASSEQITQVLSNAGVLKAATAAAATVTAAANVATGALDAVGGAKTTTTTTTVVPASPAGAPADQHGE